MKLYYSVIFFIISSLGFSQFNYQRDWATYYFGNAAYCADSKLDNNGNLYVTGFVKIYNNSTFYEAYTSSNAYQTFVGGGLTDAFLAKFSPEGILLWCTYYGGNEIDCGNRLAFDSNGNVYLVGHTRSISGIATSGAFLTTIPTYLSCFMAKFNSSGTRIWGTYFYGTIYDISINNNDEIFIGGYTNNTTNVATDNVFQQIAITGNPNTADANWNCYINKFDIQGNRILGTYCGKTMSGVGGIGEIDPYSREFCLKTDQNNNIIIVGLAYADSTNSFASLGCFKPYHSGESDMFISKFNSDLSERLWSTYYGGEGNEDIGEIIIDNTDIYITGVTTSNTEIASPGAFIQTKTGSLSNGLLCKFDTNGNRQWSTYFGGIRSRGNGIAVKNDKLYVVGQSRGLTQNINITTSGAYQEDYLGSEEGFFAEFNATTGMRNWCSYYGGSLMDIICSVKIGNENQLYLTGNTTSATNISTAGSLQPNGNFTQGAFQTVPYNLFIAKFIYNPLGITNNPTSQFEVFPNPSNGIFQILVNQYHEKLDVEIYDLNGRLVHLSQNQDFQNQRIIDISNLQSGVYLLKAKNEKINFTQKIIKN